MAEASEIITLDIDLFIIDLMKEMGFSDDETDLWEEMYEGLLQQVNFIIMNTIASNANPMLLDERVVNYQTLDNLSDLIAEMVELDANLQEKILESLNTFYEETIATYKAF